MPTGAVLGESEAAGLLPCLTGNDDVTAGIRADLAAKGSVLGLMKGYVDELRGQLDNDALPFRKLARLFELGAVPDRIEGHHFGVTLGLRTGDLRGPAAEIGNVLGVLWGETVGGVCPWVGKSFTPMGAAEVARVAGASIPAGAPVFRGINHFRAIEGAHLNAAANAVLRLIWRQEQPPAAEAARYGHQRNGGHFLAHRAPSVHPATPRAVFRLNYRYPALENSAPLPALIDEVVEIAPGMYLGQLVFATRGVGEAYEAGAPDASHAYQQFGYFLIFTERWNDEARRLFPHLGIPPPRGPTTTRPLLATAAPSGTDPDLWQAVRADLAGSPSPLHLLKAYSDALRKNLSTRAPEFEKLETLFLAGTAPRTMAGFYRGASVTFQSQRLLAALGVNALNVAWRFARHFSPWTGKRFDLIEAARLAELTEGHERPSEGTTFGSNTVVFRSAAEKLVGVAMEAAGMWITRATDEERRRDGYDARTFFFIGKPAKSLGPRTARDVYQFNYRWGPLRTPPPDNLCIDEIVEIADGLFLGKLLYATNLLRHWDPSLDPSAYAYEVFGYFLLMEEPWHALRVQLGFDMDNA